MNLVDPTIPYHSITMKDGCSNVIIAVSFHYATYLWEDRNTTISKQAHDSRPTDVGCSWPLSVCYVGPT